MQKTTVRNNRDVTPQWFHVDASGMTVGRLATVIATVLRGKHRPDFTPHLTAGDYVVVTNADKVHMSGQKWKKKLYRRHSGFLGSLRETPAEKKHAEDGTYVIRHAVEGMLRRNRARKDIMSRLKVFVGSEHPHTAQSPVPLPIESIQS